MTDTIRLQVRSILRRYIELGREVDAATDEIMMLDASDELKDKIRRFREMETKLSTTWSGTDQYRISLEFDDAIYQQQQLAYDILRELLE